MKSFTQPINFKNLARHEEGLTGQNVTSPNSHPVNPNNRSNSLLLERQGGPNRFLNTGSDEIQLVDKKQSVSDPAQNMLSDFKVDQKYSQEGEFSKI